MEATSGHTPEVPWVGRHGSWPQLGEEEKGSSLALLDEPGILVHHLCPFCYGSIPEREIKGLERVGR